MLHADDQAKAKTPSAAKTPPKASTTHEETRRREEQLDAGLENTFPASDPAPPPHVD